MQLSGGANSGSGNKVGWPFLETEQGGVETKVSLIELVRSVFRMLQKKSVKLLCHLSPSRYTVGRAEILQIAQNIAKEVLCIAVQTFMFWLGCRSALLRTVHRPSGRWLALILVPGVP